VSRVARASGADNRLFSRIAAKASTWRGVEAVFDLLADHIVLSGRRVRLRDAWGLPVLA